MAAAYNQSNPPRKNRAFTMQIALQDLANAGSFKANPTLASGDFKTGGDGGALADIATLPSVDPAGGIWVNVALTAAEMNFNVVYIEVIDKSSPKEWADFAISINTSG